MMRTLAILLGVIFLPLTSLSGLDQNVQTKTIRSSLNISKHEESKRFKVLINNDIFRLVVELEDALPELDIAVFDSENNLVAESRREKNSKLLQIDRLTQPHKLGPGNYEIEVSLSTNPQELEETQLGFSLKTTVIPMRVMQNLSLGATFKGKLNVTDGLYQVFELSTPSVPSALRTDLVAKEGDLDLYLLSSPQPDLNNIALESKLGHGNESLIIDQRDLKLINSSHPNKTYIMIYAPYDEADQDFELSVNSGREAPSDLKKVPQINFAQSGISRAISSTVEIFTATGTGSGCLVSDSGYVLTNYHVIEGETGDLSANIDIGYTQNPEDPSEVLFKARVVDFDKKLDLVLLKIDRSLYETALPSNYKFPYYDLGKKALPSISDDLQILGYPSIGGLGSRSSITLSKGSVSGFSKSNSSLMIKTDAIINSGSSGGAALNTKLQLIGLPTLILGESSAQFGYITPISALPEKWLKIISSKD